MNLKITPGIVYVLTNPAMPGIVKIGRTSRDPVDARLKELYSTGVPVPFECEFAGKFLDEAEVEKELHEAFDRFRLNPSREFFEIEPERVLPLLKRLSVEDVTPSPQQTRLIDPKSKEATRKLKSRRPNLNFVQMSIPVGSKLEFSKDKEQTAEVRSEKKVLFRDKEVSLTAATIELLGLDKRDRVQSGRYWLFKGKYLDEIYNETYPTE